MKLAWPIERAKEFTLGWLYPNVCQICESGPATKDDGYVCRACWNTAVKPIVPPFCDKCGLPYPGEIDGPFVCGDCPELFLQFECARAAVNLTPVVLDVLHRYKYNRAQWFEPFLADLLVTASRETVSPGNFDLIVPIPLHRARLREREFNQAERLARALSKATGVPLDHRIVKRTTYTKTQTRLSRKERAENVLNAFECNPKKQLKGERIVLIDDVLTTGATASSCATVLKKHGAGSVTVWTLTRPAYYGQKRDESNETAQIWTVARWGLK